MAEKRKRDPTFTAAEKSLLIDLVEKYYQVVECKKTDSVSIRSKNEQWSQIAVEFNSITSTHPREWTVLKTSWENLKKRAKQEQTQRNKHHLATGGGPPRKKTQDPIIDRVLELIQTRVSGFLNIYDSDGSQILSTTATTSVPVTQNILIDQTTEIEIRPDETEVTDADWSHYTPTMLRQNIAPALVEPSSPILQVSNVPEHREAQEQQAPRSSPRMAPRNMTSTSRRRPTLRPTLRDSNLNIERINLIEKIKQHSEEEHEINMKILKIQEERERALLVQENLKIEQENLKIEQENLKIEQENLKIEQEKLKLEIIKLELRNLKK